MQTMIPFHVDYYLPTYLCIFIYPTSASQMRTLAAPGISFWPNSHHAPRCPGVVIPSRHFLIGDERE